MPKSLDLHSERLHAIDLLLRWEGEVSNARLRELFKIHFTHASRLIAAYRERYPHRARPDVARKRFVATALEAEPVYEAGGLNAYMQLLEKTASPPPGLVMLRNEVADVVPQVFATLLQAIRDKQGVQVAYRSMTHPKPQEKTLFPHASVHTQGRWHVRAYCADSCRFRDFVVGRMTKVHLRSEPSPSSGADDQAWQLQLELQIEPHVDLSSEQADVVRAEHFRGGRAMVRSARAALVPYMLHELRIAVDPQKQSPPEYLLMVKNRKAIAPWLFGHGEGDSV